MEGMTEFSDRVAGSLEGGSAPWREVPAGAGLPLRFDGTPYGGPSVLSLWMAAAGQGFERPTWLSRQRIDELGGRVKPGAEPAPAFLRGRRPRRHPGPGGGLGTVDVWQSADVWCVDAIDGLPAHLYGMPGDFRGPGVVGDRVLERGAGGSFGHFAATFDGADFTRTQLPREVAAELVRWTASPARMNRDPDGVGEGLVAEIGAAVMLAEFGLSGRDLGADRLGKAAAAKMAGLIRGDSRAVFRAAREATDAVEWLRRQVPGYRQLATLVSRDLFRPRAHADTSVLMAAGGDLANSGATSPSSGWSGSTDDLAPLLAAQQARRVTGEALGFRYRPVPSGDDGGAWRARAATLIQDLAGLDLHTPRVRAAVEAEVAVAAARPAEVVSAERFVADFRQQTQRRLEMADLTEQHTRSMSVGEVAVRL